MRETFLVWFENLGFLKDFRFELSPQAFFIGGKPIAWYGIIICVGIICAYLLSSRKATRLEGLSCDDFLDYVLFTVPIGIVGARLFYVIPCLDQYPDFWSAIAIWNGGLAITGGIVFGIGTIVAVSLVKKKSFLKVLDAVAPGVLLAQAIGRWGNFFNGEVFGVETGLPWAMSLQIRGAEYLNRHLLFLYECLLNLVGFALIFAFYKKKRFDGQHAFFYLFWYGTVRSLLAPLRDATYQLTVKVFGLELLFSQLITLACAFVGLVALIGGFVWAARHKEYAVVLGPGREKPKKGAPQPQSEAEPQPQTDTQPQTCEEKETSDDTQDS